MSMQVVTRYFVILCLALSGCAAPTNVNKRVGLQRHQDPEQFAVDSKHYPIYRIEESIYRPPPVMLEGNALSVNAPREEILATDIWKVTYVCNDHYYIFSDDHQTRREKLIKSSSSYNVIADFYLYHLLIDKTGKVIGWVPFKNKKNVVLRGDRGVVFDPEYWRNPEWEKLPSLKPIGQFN